MEERDWRRRGDWWPERAYGVEHVVDWLMHRIEHDAEPARLPSVDPLPIATGLPAFDRVCLGLRSGTVTLVEADLPAHAEALASTIASSLDADTLYAVESLENTAIGLVAASSGVPAVMIHEERLSDDERFLVRERVRNLAARPLWLTEAESLTGLVHILDADLPRVLVVHDPAHLGDPTAVVRDLATFAAVTGVAVLVVSGRPLHLSRDDEQRLVRVVMCSHELAGRAVLATSDADDPLAVGHVRVDVLTGRVE